jgi:hypothetical protein
MLPYLTPEWKKLRIRMRTVSYAASTLLLRSARRFLNRVHKFDSCRGHHQNFLARWKVCDGLFEIAEPKVRRVACGERSTWH